ncbi:uncharacterized protein FIBRA_08702 [Fibroporia radiculosa]|uniref:MHD domain-containing protein n=1 Tax=Fibroporia radiculosa TaxID=599839 RepID=J4GXA2_9APHY|nr:uncharacterized protein FIBRA_08702 [Fibroporia radiculosa]CCM06440.1 predicted protein [Fibroporia radiculosa]
MISAFFIFNQKGEVSRLPFASLTSDIATQSSPVPLPLSSRRRSIADVFRIQVVSNSDVRSPIITLGSTSFFHVRVNNLYVVAVTKCNANAALVFEFCYRFISIAKSYFGKVDEEAIKNNFVLIYELIDEINDFGYPQNSEADTLKTYITTESVMSTNIAPEESSRITVQATGATSWRRGDVKYKKNEAFVDVVETVNLSMSAKGTTLRADVDGHIMMRAYLTGTPECKFGLNDKLVIDKNDRGASDAVELDDCRFHQCVRLTEFDTDRTISFIPPDGEFELMRYRSTSNVKLPLKVIPSVTEVGTTQVQYVVTVKTNFNNKLSATNVVVRIPTPLNTTTVDCKVISGKAKYVPAENVVVWKLQRIQGGQEVTLSATAALTSTTNRQVWARPPIDVDFQVLMFTASGLIVRFLKVFEKSGYQSIKWVRYLTKASGSYQIRTSYPHPLAMTITELATLELVHPYTWDTPSIRAFFARLATEQAACSGHQLFFFRRAQSERKIFLVSGWASLEAHREWIAGDKNQELLRMADALLTVAGLVHMDIDFGAMPGDTKRIAWFAVGGNKTDEGAGIVWNRTRNVPSDGVEARARWDWAGEGKSLDEGGTLNCCIRAYTQGDTDRLTVAGV